MDPTSNFISYRSTLKAAMWRSAGATDDLQRIVIPFFSLLVKDLYFLNEGCSNKWVQISSRNFFIYIPLLWALLFTSMILSPINVDFRMAILISTNSGKWPNKSLNSSHGNKCNARLIVPLISFSFCRNAWYACRKMHWRWRLSIANHLTMRTKRNDIKCWKMNIINSITMIFLRNIEKTFITSWAFLKTLVLYLYNKPIYLKGCMQNKRTDLFIQIVLDS